jgi:hypothetical protein
MGRIVVRRADVGVEKDSIAHYLLRFPRYRRDDAAATRLAEGFVYGMSLACGPIVEDHPDSPVIRVPDNMVCGARIIQLEDLVALEQFRQFEDRSLDDPWATIGSAASTTPRRHETAWRIACVTFNNDALFDATRFLNRSHNNFCVSPGQIREVVADAEAVPRTASHQTNLEDALQNAFKAIEAVIGDPPRDDRKFFDKLKNIGIEPQTEVVRLAGVRFGVPKHA